MALSLTQLHPIMCITQDNLPWSHVEQTRRLCQAGAQWVQLRMKRADRSAWLAAAIGVVGICREHCAICIINDSVDIALAAGADGVHLGRNDGSWRDARRTLGPRFIVGGTVNNADDARHAATVEGLDYVGVGPWRFTSNKQNLAPLLGAEGVQALVRQLDGIPAWAIGGIEPDDLAAVHATGARGVAVSSALFREGRIDDNFRRIATAWPGTSTPSQSSS